MGFLVFFDDYVNLLIVGFMMRFVVDKMKILREKLVFIIDVIVVLVVGLVIIFIWIGFEVGLIYDVFESISIDVDVFGIFLNIILFRFYNILILVFIVILVLLLKEFGLMRKVEIKFRSRKISIDFDEGVEELDDLVLKNGVKLSVWNVIILIGILIIVVLVLFYYSGYIFIMGGDDKVLI